MTGGRAGAGVVVLVLLAVCSGVAAARFCRHRLPRLMGPYRVLGTVLIALAAVLMTAQLLGAVGLFRFWVLVAAIPVASALMWFAAGPAPAGPAAAPTRGIDEPGAGPMPVWARVGSWAAAGAVLARWADVTVDVVRRGGIFSFDSVNYHLTFAARFVHDGWLTRLAYVSIDPTHAFHPVNGELLQAITMLMVGNDVLVAGLNLAWLALLLLGGWCLAERWGAGPLGLLASAVVAATPVFISSQAGTAGTDVAALALLVTALALLSVADGDGDGGTIALAGVAAGLSVASKLTVLAPVGLLTVLVAIAYRRRLRTLTGWVVGLLATGSYWYVRNLVRTGNPFPNLSFGGLLPSPAFPLNDQFGSNTLLHHVGHLHVVRHVVLPAFKVLGLAPALLLVLAFAGAVVALIVGPPRVRLLGGLALALALSYTVTPMTGFGPQANPYAFVIASNTRYLVPALVVSLAAGAVALVVRYRRGAAAATVWLGLIGLLEIGRRPGLLGGRTSLLILGAVVGTGLALIGHDRWPARPRPALVVGALAIITAVGGTDVAAYSRGYVGKWFTNYPDHSLVAAWQAVAHGHDRVGVHAIELDYPFAGPRFSNHVEWIVVQLPHGGIRAPRSCAEWRGNVNQRRLDWVVVSDRPVTSLGFGLPEAVHWTGDDPAARLVVHRGFLWVYRLRGPLHPAACGS